MPAVFVEITGLQELTAYFNSIKGVEHVIEPIIRARAELVFDESQVMCPIDTGYLRASAYMTENFGDVGAGDLAIEIVYSAPYAIYVHEDLTKKHASPTSAKFLEIPATNNAGGFFADINEAVEKFLSGA